MVSDGADSRYVISILVQNNSGVLRRVSNLFARRAYNIDSLSVGRTHDDKVSKITIVVFANSATVIQIQRQLEKLIEVISVDIMHKSTSVYRELVFIRLETDDSNRSEILALSKVFRARIVDVAQNTIIFEATGDPGKIDAMIGAMSRYKVLEITRTGLSAIRRGNYLEKNTIV